MSKIQIPRHPVFKDFGIVNLPSGTFVCPGWIPVPLGTTRDQIEFSDDILIEPDVISAEVKPEPVKSPRIEHSVTSSNGKTQYNVVFDRGMWSCTCPASTFRRGHCKHIKMFETNLQENV